MLKALLWDLDGTLAETERDGHRVAFNRAFEALGLPWRWDEAHYGRLLAVAGGRERLLHDMRTRSDAPATGQQREQLAAELHALKNRLYADIVNAGGIGWRDGVAALMDECRTRGVRMAIATTTSRRNVDALLAANGAAGAFELCICGEDVQRKKPDPEVYRLALQRLGVGALDAVAIEDSPGGVAAARAASLPVVATPGEYFRGDTFDAVTAIGPGLHTRRGWRPALSGDDGPVTLDDLAHWCRLGDSVSQFA